MRCSYCGADNRAGAKFCNECATPFAAKCAQCGAANKPGAKFCDECAASLASPSTTNQSAQAIHVAAEQAEASAVDGERKTVTALFADIKGSTELEQDLDPEEARAIVDPALKLMIEAVRRYDGYIVQSTGDGIFGLFGAPVAHEDHPQRALYAALRMQEELKRYSARLRETGNLPLEARVGVNTGEVVVRSITTGEGHTEYTPIGHTANLASRMQALAPTGSIAISEQTRRFCEGYFELKPLGPTRVKGVSEPANVYEVTGLGALRTRLQRSAGRGYTKFVGRQREMDAMKAAAERAQAGRGQIVAAMAEAGVGKSRLIFEFKATSAAGWMVLEAFSVSHGKASSYLPVIDLLHSYFKIASQDDQRTRREKIAGRIAILDRTLESAIPYLYSLLGVAEASDPLSEMDPQTRRRGTLDAIKRILLRESLNQPLMVIFEDLHWIDEGTQALLNLLADSIGTAKILLLVNYRPEYSHQWNSKTYYTQLRLDPLGKESADEMLSALLGDGAEVRPLKRLIIERTEGNPFFMEETVLVLFDEGALVRNGTVKLIKALGELKIPPTVQAILASRIDRLAPDHKDLLQTLAVIGTEFKLGLVRRVAAKPGPELEPMLSELQLGEFIYEQPAVGDVEYTFKHALTHDVAYHSVLNERRRMLHGRIGPALESMYADNLDDHVAELAHHYARSGNPRKAVDYCMRAVLQCGGRGARTEALAQFETGLKQLLELPDDDARAELEFDLRHTAHGALFLIDGMSSVEMKQSLARTIELCRRRGINANKRFEALMQLCMNVGSRGEALRHAELAPELVARAEETGDAAYIAEAVAHLAGSKRSLGDFEGADQDYDRALALLDSLSMPTADLIKAGKPQHWIVLYDRVSVIATAGWNQWLLGYPDRARERVSVAMAYALEPVSKPLLANGHLFAFVFYDLVREFEHVRKHAQALLDTGVPTLRHWAENYLGWAGAMAGDLEGGIARMRHHLSKIRSSGSESASVGALARIGAALGLMGRFDEGLDAIDEAFLVIDRTGDRMVEAEVHRLKGELLLAQDASNAAPAEQCFRTAIEISRKQHAKSWELRATTSLAHLLDKQGKRDEARAMLAEIYNWFTEGFDTADLKEAKALLEELSA
ncbi:MAG TPA: adenylate/guanylate cyclase domain-containing protein [Candidatus Binataceae bacterium]